MHNFLRSLVFIAVRGGVAQETLWAHISGKSSRSTIKSRSVYSHSCPLTDGERSMCPSFPNAGMEVDREMCLDSVRGADVYCEYVVLAFDNAVVNKNARTWRTWVPSQPKFAVRPTTRSHFS